MTLFVLSMMACALAAMQAGQFFKNLPRFCVNLEPSPDESRARPEVSVLIPARDEAEGIGKSLASILASKCVTLEIIVMDDHSTDTTAAIVRRAASEDKRVRYLLSAALPAGWNGKQHACMQLEKAAKFDRLVFLDADVRLQPDGLSKLMAYQDRSRASLLSAFPHQVTGTVLEKLLIPMMHTILLCFLPMTRMRSSHHVAYAAGCGQLFLTSRDAYSTAGTHAAIRSSRHDGLKLPRAYRGAGLMTDVIDGTELARCRMYSSAPQVVRGLLKNADEGIANAKLIVPFTIMLIGSSVLPFALLAAVGIRDNAPYAAATTMCSVAAIVLSHLPRAVAATKFRQSWLGVVFHSVAVVIFVALQWIALGNRLCGRQIAWRGRVENHGIGTI